jgi:hypothetical protein
MPFAELRTRNHKTIIFPSVYDNSQVPDSEIIVLGQRRDQLMILDDGNFSCLKSEEVRIQGNNRRSQILHQAGQIRWDDMLSIDQPIGEPFLIYPRNGIRNYDQTKILLGNTRNPEQEINEGRIGLLFRTDCDYDFWRSDLLLEPYDWHEHKVSFDKYTHLIGLADTRYKELGARGGLEQIRATCRPTRRNQR